MNQITFKKDEIENIIKGVAKTNPFVNVEDIFAEVYHFEFKEINKVFFDSLISLY